MILETLRESLPDYAKDIKLNLSSVLTTDGAPDLTEAQIAGIALASAYATKNAKVIAALEEETRGALEKAGINAARAAATIMGMNNIYYRFVHLMGESPYKTMAPKLRMNVIGNPGIAKVDFELYALAVSAINGCGMCMEAHVHEVQKGGISQLGVQSAIRIASVIHALAQAVVIVG